MTPHEEAVPGQAWRVLFRSFNDSTLQSTWFETEADAVAWLDLTGQDILAVHRVDVARAVAVQYQRAPRSTLAPRP